MKKLLAIIGLLLLTVCVYAQYVPEHVAKRSGCTIKLDGQKLSQAQVLDLVSDIEGEDYSAQWKKARGWRTGGIVMVSVGGAAIVGGTTFFLAGVMVSTFGAVAGGTVGAIGGQESANNAANKGAKAGVPIMIGGLSAVVAGVALVGGGIPLIAVNCKKMNQIVDKYNEVYAPAPETTDVELTFGGTPNGIGLCLNF